jgi:hypothetical protein
VLTAASLPSWQHVPYNCIFSFRELTQEDFEAGIVTLAVSSAAALEGNRGNVTGNEDTATLSIDGRSAAMDIFFKVTPTTVHDAGEAAESCISSIQPQAAYTW